MYKRVYFFTQVLLRTTKSIIMRNQKNETNNTTFYILALMTGYQNLEFKYFKLQRVKYKV
jgi:hypothetical protein